jgi:hypothetical protein
MIINFVGYVVMNGFVCLVVLEVVKNSKYVVVVVHHV